MISAKVLTMAESTLKAMFYTQVKLVAIVMALVGLVSAAGVATYKTMAPPNATQRPLSVTPPVVSKYRMKITFSGYNKPEALTNFPALVIFDTNRGSFSYGQFTSTKSL
jgi:hypothetical protein